MNVSHACGAVSNMQGRAQSTRHIVELPSELWERVLGLLPVRDICAAVSTSRCFAGLQEAACRASVKRDFPQLADRVDQLQPSWKVIDTLLHGYAAELERTGKAGAGPTTQPVVRAFHRAVATEWLFEVCTVRPCMYVCSGASPGVVAYACPNSCRRCASMTQPTCLRHALRHPPAHPILPLMHTCRSHGTGRLSRLLCSKPLACWTSTWRACL